MPNTISAAGLPRTVHGTTTADTQLAGPHLALSYETQRLPGSETALTHVAAAVLHAAPIARQLACQLQEAVRISAQYVYGHSDAPCYRLLITSDDTGLTVAVTDHADQFVAGPPAWLRITRPHNVRQDGIRPHDDPSTRHIPDGGLQLHRTLDGHIRLGRHAPWDTSSTT
ncbi:hypothetical protein [Streptomyces flavofungini]|uniref:Regulatory protein n=1 Tax=Streptomyces flavofungini TaxID=68200 RepID=A0ABS0XIE1_9ACTN|nr:hypothetical protein [Streptomyces flavofungini]MBJ3812982.1 hypothetical protein [Streptomyces flavofungini]GHC84207.1 hypothetical protein GCM10010349_69060 [Streptomyces flavofungini]